MKNKRQFAILEIISESDVETQEDLTAHLIKRGFKVTQATVSRDIKELNIIKAAGKNGAYKYTKNPPSDAVPGGTERFKRVLQGAVIKLRTAKNLVVIKTYPGMAPAAGAAVDAFDLPEIVGSIAGDDTIFLAAESDEDAEVIFGYLKQML